MLRSAARKAMCVVRGLALFGGAAFGLALVIGLTVGATSVALGADGEPFKLGVNNVATALTRLTAGRDGPAVQLQNTNAGTNATALSLQVAGDKPPMKVNSDQKVASLNSDELDNKSANGLLRVASFNGNSQLPPGNNGNMARTKITAPTAGYLVIAGGSDTFNFQETDQVYCYIAVDNQTASGSLRFMELDGASSVNGEEDCSTNAVVPVSAGSHTVDLKLDLVDSDQTKSNDTSLSALYVPYGANGDVPSQATIAAAQKKGDSQAPRTASR